MSNEQKQVLQDVSAETKNVIFIDMDEAQRNAMHELGAYEDRHAIAVSAFASVLRGKVQSAMDRAIKAKYIAESKNKPAVASECEVEIQKWLTIKRGL